MDYVSQILGKMYELKHGHNVVTGIEFGLDVHNNVIGTEGVDIEVDSKYITKFAGLPVKINPGMRPKFVLITFNQASGLPGSRGYGLI